MREALTKISRRVGGKLDDSVLELSGKKMERIKRAFDISEAELDTVTEGDSLQKALVDLVIERVALLATAR